MSKNKKNLRKKESIVNHIVKKPHVVKWGFHKKRLVDRIRIVIQNNEPE